MYLKNSFFYLLFKENEVELVSKNHDLNEQKPDIFNNFKISIEINILAVILFLSAVSSRFFKLDQPRNVV